MLSDREQVALGRMQESIAIYREHVVPMFVTSPSGFREALTSCGLRLWAPNRKRRVQVSLSDLRLGAVKPLCPKCLAALEDRDARGEGL